MHLMWNDNFTKVVFTSMSFGLCVCVCVVQSVATPLVNLWWRRFVLASQTANSERRRFRKQIPFKPTTSNGTEYILALIHEFMCIFYSFCFSGSSGIRSPQKTICAMPPPLTLPSVPFWRQRPLCWVFPLSDIKYIPPDIYIWSRSIVEEHGVGFGKWAVSPNKLL